jgi:antitoxin (DNA-binding transcriptional repressor) of toxin-antitoxin stability system
MDINIAEAKNRFSELIRAVEDGERVVITRHGSPSPSSLPRLRAGVESGWAG